MLLIGEEGFEIQFLSVDYKLSMSVWGPRSWRVPIFFLSSKRVKKNLLHSYNRDVMLWLTA